MAAENVNTSIVNPTIIFQALKTVHKNGFGASIETGVLWRFVENENYKIERIKALLIRQIMECFGCGVESDILLMTFKLLVGYTTGTFKARYTKYIQNNCAVFLKELHETNYTEYLRCVEAGDSKGLEDVYGKAGENLYRTDIDNLIEKLSKQIVAANNSSELKNYGNYFDTYTHKAILQVPSYEGESRRIAASVSTEDYTQSTSEDFDKTPKKPMIADEVKGAIGVPTQVVHYYPAPTSEQVDEQSNTAVAMKSTRSRVDQVNGSLIAQTIENVRRDQAAYFSEFKQVNTLDIDFTILPKLTSPKGETVELRTALLNHTANSVILLCGAGGIGKSYITFACCEELQRDETFDEYRLVPIFVPMKDVVGSEESPILHYTSDKHFASLDCDRDSNSIKKAVRDLTLNGAVKFVFFLDGLNEFTLAVSENENRAVHNEIKWLQCLKNIIVVISTRSDKGFYKYYKLQVNELGRQQVEAYLRHHENTALVNQVPLKSKNVHELLRNPLLLALFTKTYSPEYTELNDMRMETHADVLKLCVEYQKKRLRGTSRANFVLDILLPLVTLSTDMKLQIEAGSLAEEIRHELQITLSETYKPLWFQGYHRKDFTGLDLADEIVLFYDLIGDTILENGVFLIQHQNMVSWQHELLMEWFSARAIVIALEYQRDYAVEKIMEICRNLMANDEKISKALPTALFLFEMLDSTEESDSNEFIELVSAIARSYSDTKDDLNTYKFAVIALNKMEKGCMTGYPRWKYAVLRNNIAYRLLSVRVAGDHFNREKCVDYASQIIVDSLKMIQHEPGDGLPEEIKLAEAHIHGNLGASCLARYELTKDPAWVYKALDHHKDGLEARRLAFTDAPDCDAARCFTGTSYHCFATDYFKLGCHEDSMHNYERAAEQYRSSLANHRQAVVLRETGCASDPEKLASYNAYIGTLMKLLSNTPHAEYVEESLHILQKLLKLNPKDALTISSLESLLRNDKMLETIRNHCAGLIAFVSANPGMVNPEVKGILREAAARIDQCCHEVLIDSDLLAQIV